jgi:amidase
MPNPADEPQNPAGSSSGSAVGVAAGFAPVSLGTETEGSLIVPAGRAALYTLKPTISIISQKGVVPITSLFDSVGPMTKGVEDLATLMDILVEPHLTKVPSGGYRSAVTGSWKGLKIGTLDPEVWNFPASARKSEPAAEKQMVRLIQKHLPLC